LIEHHWQAGLLAVRPPRSRKTMNRPKASKFLVSLLRRRGGWFANTALEPLLPIEFMDDFGYTTIIEFAEPLARRRGSALDR
jgi:hypothetical protein